MSNANGVSDTSLVGWGLDPSAMDALGLRFQRAVARLRALGDPLLRWSASADRWVGPDADAFQRRVGARRSSIEGAIERLSSLARLVDEQAAQQRRASDVGIGGSTTAPPLGDEALLARLEVERRSFHLGFEGFGEYLAPGGGLDVELVRTAAGGAVLTLTAEPQLLAALGVGREAVVGAGGMVRGTAVVEFDSYDDVERFIDSLDEELRPSIPDVIDMGAAGQFGVVSWIGTTLGASLRRHGGRPRDVSLGPSAVIDADFGGAAGVVSGQLGVHGTEGYEYDAIDRQWTYRVTADAEASASVLGLGVSGDVSVSVVAPVGSAAPEVPLSIEVSLSGDASLDLLAKLGLSDTVAGVAGGWQPNAGGTVTVSGELATTEGWQPGNGPLDMYRAWDDMARSGELIVTIERTSTDHTDLGFGVVSGSFDYVEGRTTSAWHRSGSGAWRELEW